MYVPSTDFVGLWRSQIGGGAKKAEMPGLDFVMAALDRAGIINIAVSGTAPTSNQSTTAWFRPASPSAMGEGFLYMWDGAAYVLATPALFSNLVTSSSTTLAPIASPVFTGDPKAPTPSPGDNDTSIATTAFVAASYAPLASPVLTGDPKAPTPSPGDNDTSIATTAFVANAVSNYAALASPVFTGDPKAPTPTVGDNDTSIATTAFVQAAVVASVAGVTFIGNRSGIITLNGGNLLTNELATPRYDVAQSLSVSQQAQARANIRATAAGIQVSDYNTHAFENGTFYSNAAANGPIAHLLGGVASVYDANNMVIRVDDMDYTAAGVPNWANTTFYNPGDRIFDNVGFPAYFVVNVGHLTGNAPATFAQLRASTPYAYTAVPYGNMTYMRIKRSGTWSAWIKP
jgi:hypothetical protein